MSKANGQSRTAVMEIDEKLHAEFFAIVGNSEEGKRISQSKAAQALGYSAGVVSAYKAKTYNGNITNLEEKIRSWLKREAHRKEQVNIPVVETMTFKQIKRAIEIAHEDKDIAVIIGDAGTGKTTALRQYKKENPTACLIEVDPTYTKRVLISEIAHAVGVEAKGITSQIVKRIIETLNERDTVLIIDEADYLTDACLELVRRIINDKGSTGVILVGLPRLEYKLRNLRNDHEQLTSRVGVMFKVSHMKSDDAGKILKNVWPEITDSVTASFLSIANESVRTLTKLIGRVHRVMLLNNLSEPTEEAVETASELLMKNERR